MRRRATSVLVFGLLVLGLAAAGDALKENGDEPTAVMTTNETGAAAAALEAAGARGTITYSDENCRLHALRLPSLVAAPAPRYSSCEPHIPSGGLGILRGEVVWSGLGFQAVQVVLSRSELAAAVSHEPEARELAFGGAGPYEATQLASLGSGRYAVVLVNRKADWEPLLAIFEGTRLLSLRVRAVGLRDRVRPSPRGRYLAVIHPQGIDVYRGRAGPRQIVLPTVTAPHALAWSPDDHWTALATRYSVYVFPSDRPDETIRIPLAVRDLDWGT